MRSRRTRPAMLAGWLFADLFLVLLLTGLAELPPKDTTKPISGPSPTPTARHESGLDPHHIDFNIGISPSDFRGGAQDRFVKSVDEELARRNRTKRPVGFVLIFASGPSGGADQAQRTATSAFNLLHRRSAAFASSTGLGYWSGSGDHFEFKIFLLR